MKTTSNPDSSIVGQEAVLERRSALELGGGGLSRALRKVGPLVLFGVIPLLLSIAALDSMHRVGNQYGFDFRGTLWEPAGAIVDGENPYPTATRESVLVGNPTVYPPLPILMVVPLALLPWKAALVLWMLILASAVVAALRLVGVKDWRCHALALASPPVLHGLFFGNLTIFLLLPVALAWRWRAHAFGAGIALAAAVAAKIFLLPLVLWLVLLRRFRAAIVALVGAAVLVVLPWAVIGFEGMREYPALLDVLEDYYAPSSFSVPTALSGVLEGSGERFLASFAVATAMAGLAAHLSRGTRGEHRSFAVLVTASVIASPIVWPSYLALLLVPLAILRPRFSMPWLAVYTLWAAEMIDDQALEAAGFNFVVLGFLLLLLIVQPRSAKAVVA